MIEETAPPIPLTYKDTRVQDLEQQVALLKQLLDIKYYDKDVGGVFILHVKDITSSFVEDIQRVWKQTMLDRDGNSPPLLVVGGDISIKKFTYDGQGIFVVKAPISLSQAMASRLSDMWNGVWRRTSTPNVPMCVIPLGVEIVAMSAFELQARGLMRIPSESNFGG